jgi:hypothetical protein
MTAHKFKTGQSVTMTANRLQAVPKGRFNVVRILPAERGINHYRIKSATDGHERVVMEGEIS